MRGRFVSGITTGVILGAAASMMRMPQMDRNTKRRIRKSGRYVKDFAEDAMDGMRNMMR